MKHHGIKELLKFHQDYSAYISTKCVDRLRIDKEHATAKKLFNLSVETQTVDYRMFSKILHTFYKGITDSLIKTGVPLNFGSNMGRLSILLKERRPRTNKITGKAQYPIDWGASLKLKKEIIERGDIPYHKDNAPNGENWFVYHTKGWNPYIVWRQGTVLLHGKKPVSKYGLILFHPSSGEKGFQSRLYEHRKNNPGVEHVYEKFYVNKESYDTTNTVGSNNQ